MALFLFIDSGSQKGMYFYLRDKAIIGRRKGVDIYINNPTISAKHAQVEKSGDKVFLNSLSPRGILLDSHVHEQIELKDNMCFAIGEIAFSLRRSLENLSSWKSLLLLTFADLSKQQHISQMTSKKVLPFYKRLKLTITQGRQTGITWCIGYGPRYIGTDSVDFPVYEPAVGPCGFYLDPLKQMDSKDHKMNDSGVIFFTKQRSIVHLNRKPVKSKMLQNNDVIQLVDTCLQVQIEDISS